MKANSKIIGLGLSAATSLFAVNASAATCSFNAVDQRMDVGLSSGESATISTMSSGVIHVNGAACGAAAVTNVGTVVVAGNTGDERLTLDFSRRAFAPGTVAQNGPADVREIAFAIDLGAGTRDTVVFTGGVDADTVVVGSLGGTMSADEDAEVSMANVERVEMNGMGGNDLLSGEGGFGCGSPSALALTLNGGDGDDDLLGGTGADSLLGSAGNDVLSGGAGADSLNGGAGDDYEDGGAGNDLLNQGNMGNGADLMFGGDGRDSVTYSKRTYAVVVTLDGFADDGEIYGEMDNVGVDIEDVQGGSGEDYIVGSSANNELIGGAGTDWIEGGMGNDTILGGAGDDYLFGNEGSDHLSGQTENDFLEGGSGVDTFICGSGVDSAPDVDAGTGLDCELI